MQEIILGVGLFTSIVLMLALLILLSRFGLGHYLRCKSQSQNANDAQGKQYNIQSLFHDSSLFNFHFVSPYLKINISYLSQH